MSSSACDFLGYDILFMSFPRLVKELMNSTDWHRWTCVIRYHYFSTKITRQSSACVRTAGSTTLPSRRCTIGISLECRGVMVMLWYMSQYHCNTDVSLRRRYYHSNSTAVHRLRSPSAIVMCR